MRSEDRRVGKEKAEHEQKKEREEKESEICD